MLIYSQDLLPEEKRLWMDLNEPPYNAFRDSENLIKPEKATLRWLVDMTILGPRRVLDLDPHCHHMTSSSGETAHSRELCWSKVHQVKGNQCF